MTRRYSLGIDFGTLSVRTALFDVETGEEFGTSIVKYQHGVLEKCLPSGVHFPKDYALQDVRDYWASLDEAIPSTLKKAKISKDNIISMGLDFTACTVLPVKSDGTPLCILTEYETNPHAWVKLWKHHAAKPYANELTKAAQEKEAWLLEMYGGKLSPELLLCKALEIYKEAPEIFQEAAYFLEAGDYMTWMLTGHFHRSEAAAGICGCWKKGYGYPSKEYLNSVATGFGDALDRLLSGEHLPIGFAAGGLRSNYASKWGLKEGMPVAVALVDSQAAVPGAGINGEGKMLATIGTSTVFILMGDRPIYVAGMGACSKDSVLPGYYSYSAGQSCVGDHFAWVVENIVPESYYVKAAQKGCNLYTYLRQLAEKQEVGQHGLLVLDWWNGNRCVLTDMDLTGAIFGLQLSTKVEDIYRALLEGTAYGARKIMETFIENGVQITEIYASGGIPIKDPLMMQIYADVLKRPVKVCGSTCGPMLGTAVLAAVAAGAARGGYDKVEDATNAMGQISNKIYVPIKENSHIYDKLYADYLTLHDYFGRGENEVMKRLLKIKHNHN